MTTFGCLSGHNTLNDQPSQSNQENKCSMRTVKIGGELMTTLGCLSGHNTLNDKRQTKVKELGELMFYENCVNLWRINDYVWLFE